MKALLILLLLLPKTSATIFQNRQALALENLVLRQQLAVLQRSVKRPQLTNADRCFWILLYRFWNGWDKVNVLIDIFLGLPLHKFRTEHNRSGPIPAKPPQRSDKENEC